jgi:hypothetical protein
MSFHRVPQRRARTIISYWQDAKLVLQNYPNRIRISVEPETISLFNFFETWQAPTDFYASMADFQRGSLVAELRQLLKFGFLVQQGSPAARRDTRIGDSPVCSWRGGLGGSFLPALCLFRI